MILYTDNVVQLYYYPADDILLASLHIVREYDAREARSAFMAIVNHINQYSISRLLLDFSHNTLDLKGEEYKQNITMLTAGLMDTPLRKLARVGIEDPVQEQKIAAIYKDIKSTLTPSFELENFSSREDALAWLKE